MKPQILLIFAALMPISAVPNLKAEPVSSPIPAKDAKTAEIDSRMPAVCRAIKLLGDDPTPRQISGVVYLMVKAEPKKVLDIVCHAVHCSAAAAAPGIVGAAIAALPDPWKQVVYVPGDCTTVKGQRLSSDGKTIVQEEKWDGKTIIQQEKNVIPAEDPSSGDTISLAEAIVQTAMSAKEGLDLSALEIAAQGALVGNPDLMLAAINDVRVIAAVGSAGAANYSNEPLKTMRDISDPVPPKPKPKPSVPPVSL